MKLGNKYEKAAQKALRAEFRKSQYELLINQWFHYTTAQGDEKYCEMDALVINPLGNRVWIFEIKFKHTECAYYQLFNLYKPVIRCWKPGAIIHTVELVRWYNAQTPFPTDVTLTREPLMGNPGDFNVKIWNPERGLSVC